MKFFYVILGVIILIEVYGYRAIRTLTTDSNPQLRTFALWAYIAIFIFFILNVIVVSIFREKLLHFKSFNYMLFMGGFGVLFFVPKIPIVVFELIADFTKLITWLFKSATEPNSKVYQTADIISRSNFILKIGVIIALIPFVSFFYAMVKGRYNFEINRFRLSYQNLPASFSGLKIVQVSDIHLGNFGNSTEKLQEVVDLINEQDPDLVFITGDIVNILASELTPYISVLQNVKAKTGKYAILGNHDYGDYYTWESEQQKKDNLNTLIENYKKTGFKLLLNENEVIESPAGNLGIIGIENWGLPPFPQYGDFEKAKKNMKKTDFNILLAHDPTFFEVVVKKEDNINLTLSGHTHGFQMAVDIPGLIRWSPVQYKYKQWGGLYKEDKGILYVNVGLGVVGYPGRIGVPPEISVFELSKE